MVKRLLILSLLLIFVVGSVGTMPGRVNAAPAMAVKDAPNADLLPADTALYADFRIADLNKTLDFVGGLYEKVTGQKMPTLFTDIDSGLTKGLGRPASFEKDIQSWLGDHATVSVQISDEQIAALEAAMKDPTSKPNQLALVPQYLVIIAVKDDAAASKFITEALDKSKAANPTAALTTRTDTVNGAPATIYEQGGLCETSCVSFVVAKGFLMIGQTTGVNKTLEGYKAKAPALSADANFAKIMNALQPGNLVSVFINPRLYVYSLSMQMTTMRNRMGDATPDASQTGTAPDPTAMIHALQSAIQGQAFALRLDAKAVAIDIVQAIDVKAMGDVYAQMGLPLNLAQITNMQPLEFTAAKQVPANALAVITSRGLGTLYSSLRDGLKAAAKTMQGQSSGKFGNGKQFTEVSDGIAKAEAALKVIFDIDVNEDVLSWLNGEFALYVGFNQKGNASKLNGSTIPFDPAFIVESSDVAKTKTFLDKLNTGLTKNNTKPESKGTDLYMVTPQNSPGIVYGLVGNTFLVTTDNGLATTTAAIKGDGVITNNPAWKNALAQAATPTAQFWFVNFSEIQVVVKSLMASVDSNSSSNPQTQMALKLLDQFESLSLSSGALGADGFVKGSLLLILK